MPRAKTDVATPVVGIEKVGAINSTHSSVDGGCELEGETGNSGAASMPSLYSWISLPLERS